ncbi:hypothetical protein F5148DRAFT_1152646 [Russula earlei]|uniref:Uncharacterized protein n=1 Tax=Russula earlei TaxID=71964 RepID=A0ACC0TW86_9AGAM|nr:hypothetical protein F5148DRAFT_1152646 [Russula earlei]
MAAWLGSRGMGSKHEFVGISVGVMAEMDGAGATTVGAAVDREGMAVGDVGIGAETMNGEGVTEAATVMMVGKAGAVTMTDEAKMVTPRAWELAGQRWGGVEAVVDVAEKAGACTDAGMDATGSEMTTVGKMGLMMAGGMKAKKKGSGRERQREEQLRQEREGCECNVNGRDGGSHMQSSLVFSGLGKPAASHSHGYAKIMGKTGLDWTLKHYVEYPAFTPKECSTLSLP